MQITQQLTIFAANKPGVLANICGYITDQGMNIIAISVVDHIDHSIIRMVVDDPHKALHLLGEAGIAVTEDTVLRIPMVKGPGTLEMVAEALAEQGINIQYLYATESIRGQDVMLILKSADDMRAKDILEKIALTGEP